MHASAPAGWLVEIDCGSGDVNERDLLIDRVWATAPNAVEEHADRIVAGYPTEARATRAAESLGLPSAVFPVGDDSYLDEWKRFSHPQRVGNLVVRAPWHVGSGLAPADAVAITIDPGRSFGSGAHPSTRLALEMLQRVGAVGATVLDFGCGSGVLSVAALALGARRVVAVDREDDARRMTALNAARNACQTAVEVVASLDSVRPTAYEVVLANVLPSVHAEFGPQLVRAAGRELIAAGALRSQRAMLSGCYRSLELVDVQEEGEWVALRLRRRTGAASGRGPGITNR